MGIFTKDIKTMDDLFLHQLEDIYYAEQQLMKAIPKMADMATNIDLKAGLKSHVTDTKNQIERLDKVFAKLGQQPKGTDCPAIDGLIKEANETAGEIVQQFGMRRHGAGMTEIARRGNERLPEKERPHAVHEDARGANEIDVEVDRVRRPPSLVV